MKKKLIVVLLIIWMIFIFFNSLQNGDASSQTSGTITNWIYQLLNWLKISIDVNTLSLWIRKLAHLFEFFVLGILMSLFLFRYSFTVIYHGVYTIGLSLLVAITDEAIQTLVPGRNGSIVDVGIDGIGIFLGWVLVFLIVRSRKKVA